MEDKKKGKVIFIRRNGRIIPIRSKKTDRKKLVGEDARRSESEYKRTKKLGKRSKRLASGLAGGSVGVFAATRKTKFGKRGLKLSRAGLIASGIIAGFGVLAKDVSGEHKKDAAILRATERALSKRRLVTREQLNKIKNRTKSRFNYKSRAVDQALSIQKLTRSQASKAILNREDYGLY